MTKQLIEVDVPDDFDKFGDCPRVIIGGLHRTFRFIDTPPPSPDECDRLRAALEKIADWQCLWGPYPENNAAWRAMAIVTAREATPNTDTQLPPPSPDGGAQARAQGVDVADAFEFGWELQAHLSGPSVHDVRDVARVVAADYWPKQLVHLLTHKFDFTATKYLAICSLKRAIKSALAQQPSPSDSAPPLDSLALEYCEEAIEHGPGISTHYVFTLPNLRCLVAKAQPATQTLQDVGAVDLSALFPVYLQERFSHVVTFLSALRSPREPELAATAKEVADIIYNATISIAPSPHAVAQPVECEPSKEDIARHKATYDKSILLWGRSFASDGVIVHVHCVDLLEVMQERETLRQQLEVTNAKFLEAKESELVLAERGMGFKIRIGTLEKQLAEAQKQNAKGAAAVAAIEYARTLSPDRVWYFLEDYLECEQNIVRDRWSDAPEATFPRVTK